MLIGQLIDNLVLLYLNEKLNRLICKKKKKNRLTLNFLA